MPPTPAPNLRLAWTAALAVTAISAWSAFRIPVGLLKDDALHILLARSLASGAYSLPGREAIPATDPLPGMALLLLLPVKLVEPFWGLLRALPLLSTLACSILTWRLAGRVLAPRLALATALLVALNPVLLLHAGVVMPDIPYLALTLLLFELCARGTSGRRLWALAAGAGLACLLRPHGAVLAAGLALAIAARNGARKAAAFSAAAFGPLALWLLRGRMLAGTPASYLSSRFARDSGLWEPARQLAHAADLARVIFAEGLLTIDGPAALLSVVGLAVAGAAGWGAVRLLRRREEPWIFAMAAYAIGVLALHLTWSASDVRYLIPLLPISWIFLAAAAAPWLGGRTALAVAAALAAAPASRLDWAALGSPRASGPTAWPQTMTWIRENTPPQARLETMSAPSVALLAERAAEEPPGELSSREEWLAHLRAEGITYVHVDRNLAQWSPQADAGADVAFRLEPWARSTPGFSEVYENSAESSVVYKLSPKDAAP